MKKLFEKIRRRTDGNDLIRKTEELCAIEHGQTFRHYHQSADHILRLLQEAGIPNAEKVMFPADGKTSYEDKRMPLAWDATVGKLTLCDRAHTVALSGAAWVVYTVAGVRIVREYDSLTVTMLNFFIGICCMPAVMLLFGSSFDFHLSARLWIGMAYMGVFPGALPSAHGSRPCASSSPPDLAPSAIFQRSLRRSSPLFFSRKACRHSSFSPLSWHLRACI